MLFGDVYFLYLLVLNQSVEVKDNQTERVYLICVSVCLFLDRAAVLVHVLLVWVWGESLYFWYFSVRALLFQVFSSFLGTEEVLAILSGDS